MRSIFRLFALLLFASMASIVLAEDSPYWTRTATFGTSIACMRHSWNVAGTCELFPAGSAYPQRTTVLDFASAGQCCWVGAVPSSITVNGYITDSSGPNGSGYGACMHVSRSAGGMMRSRASLANMTAAATSGLRTGLCSTTVTRDGETCFAPCSSNSDCTNYGGGTCVAAPSTGQKASACMFLACAADTGTPAIVANKVTAATF